MDSPKISVLVPMYNRKHYIEQCLDSVFNQTFQDFEIIVRDDGSTDGSAEFVEKLYAPAISSGKLKLQRNEKNLGEFPTDNRLLREAAGKYIMILHSDDLYLPNALQHLYEVAEKFNADVVNGCKYLISAPDGVIVKGTPLKRINNGNHQVDKVEVISDKPLARFNEWNTGGTGIDAQHNIFSRKFLADNDLRFEVFGGNRLFALEWFMKAKIFVKTPTLFYIYRNAPDSSSNYKFPPERIKKFISEQIELSRYLDKFFAREDFFKDKPELQYLARSHLLFVHDNWRINRLGIYKDGITPELHRAVEEAFKKNFGDDAAFTTFLFHWIHAMQSDNRVTAIIPPRNVFILKAA